MAEKRVSSTIIISSDVQTESNFKHHLQEREAQLEPIWKRKPYSGTIAEPKGSGSEVKKNGLQ